MIQILFEDENQIVVDKPAGILCQRDKTDEEDIATILMRQLRAKGEVIRFLAPVHRLDRNTSGILVLAKSSSAAAELTDLFKSRKVKKIYWAIVKGDPGENGSYNFSLEKDPIRNQSFVSETGKSAETVFNKLVALGAFSLVEVSLKTGRSHQIRAHFAEAKHSLAGDRKYAKKPWSEIFHRPALHSRRIEYLDARNHLVSVTCRVPEDLRKFIHSLGGSSWLDSQE